MNKLKNRSLHLNSLNTSQFNKLKAIEELNELSLVLLHTITKAHTRSPVDDQEVISEIGDVKRYLWYLESLYDTKAIKTRIKEKIKQIEIKKGIA